MRGPTAQTKECIKHFHQQEPFILKKSISVLCQFFDREIPRLSSTYNWKIPNINGFTYAGERGYLQNIVLKAYLKTLWDNATTEEEKFQIAKTIVSDWGRVRTNKNDTLIKYVNSVSRNNTPTPLRGVSSYSKILSIIHPNRFAIYDARVAACLNAIQINANLTQGLAFNYVPGRNNVTGNTTKKIGFTQTPKFSTKRLVQSGWFPIRRNETYMRYIELLASCLKERPHYSLMSLEMALFANAESECRKAMTSTPISPTIHCKQKP